MDQHVPTGETHKISTIAELSAVATELNIDYLMADLKLCILSSLEVTKMHKAVLGEDASNVPLMHFQWIDDGITELKAINFINEKDEVQFTINKESFNKEDGK